MIRMLMWFLLVYIGYRIIASMMTGKKKTLEKNKDSDKSVNTHRDPVCGVYVSEDDAIIGKYEGERHYFCSNECLDKFRDQIGHSAH